MEEEIKIIDPGYLSVQVPADNRRGEFNFKNAVIVQNKKNVDFVFIGDSITNLLELNAYFGTNNKIILDRGISSDVTEYVLKRFDADVIQLKPKHCVLLIGINDAWALEDDPWLHKVGTPVEVVKEKAFNNIKEMVQKAKDNSIQMIICSILPTNMNFTNKNKERNIYVAETNELLKELCIKEDLIYVDYYSAFVKENDIFVRDGLTFEGLHPNTKGYNLMMDILKKTLAENNIEI